MRRHHAVAHNLEDVPVDDGSARVLNHLAPVLGLAGLARVAEDGATDGVAGPDTVIVADR